MSRKPKNWNRLGAKSRAAFFAKGRCTVAPSTILFEGANFIDGFRPKVAGHHVLSSTGKDLHSHKGFYMNRPDALEAAKKFRDDCRAFVAPAESKGEG